jgi:predicted dinucleotide-binding enzyme
MRIGILGSGAVGEALAPGFLREGHEVWLATREPGGEKGERLRAEIKGVNVCDFATAAQAAELAILCVKWTGAVEAVQLAGPDNLAGKVVIDTSNVIGMVDNFMVYAGGDTAAAEQVQAWLPNSKVVKAFNTTGADMMYKPHLHGKPTMFIAGDDADAKRQVGEILDTFGWEVLDSGPLMAARELEPMGLVWVRNSVTNGREHAFKML